MKYLALTLKDAAGNDVTIQGAGGIPTGGINALSDILRVGIIFLFLASIFLSFTYIIWGGIDWITAGGNKESIGRARQKLVYAIFGLFVVFLSFAVISIFTRFFGIEFFELPFFPGIGG